LTEVADLFIWGYGCLKKRMQSNELLHICKVVIITIADLGRLRA
jgi:hypothetical protein